MWDKRFHATYVVSNLCFDADTIDDWLHRMRKRGITLPVLIGLPGPVERAKLLSMATKIGVGQSVKFLKSHATAFARIAAPGGYNPEKFLKQSARLPVQPRAQRRRPAPLHLQPSRRDRGLAAVPPLSGVSYALAATRCRATRPSSLRALPCTHLTPLDQSLLRASERAFEEAALGVVG